MEMLKALRCVDIVRPYHELEYVSACKELQPDIFVIGQDWGDKPHNVDVELYLKSEGKKIIQVNYNPRTSSSEIKRNVMAQSAAPDLADDGIHQILLPKSISVPGYQGYPAPR